MKINEKISSAFPDNHENKNELKLQIHEDLKQPYKFNKNSLKFYSYLDPSEIEYLEQFHDELFPLKYGLSLYTSILKGKTKILILKGKIEINN